MSYWNKFAKEVNVILSMKSSGTSYNSKIKNLKKLLKA